MNDDQAALDAALDAALNAAPDAALDAGIEGSLRAAAQAPVGLTGDSQIAAGLRGGSPTGDQGSAAALAALAALDAAWAALYHTYFDRVWQLAGRLIGPDQSAVADVVQDTFMSAARSARHFDPARGPLWLWLAGIVRNQAHDYWRSQYRADRVREGGDAHALVAAMLAERRRGESAGPAAAALSAESADLVRSTLAGLAEEHQSVLVARYIEDTPVEQLAGQCQCSVEAMRSRLARARRAFRQGWPEERGSPP